MTRDEAKAKAWAGWHEGLDYVPAINPLYAAAFDAGWDAREPPDLHPVIDWLEAGCDPAEAAEELRVYQAMRDES